MGDLYWGDNLDILRNYVRDESADLIYLDPPFNSNRNYNVLFRENGKTESDAPIQAFDEIGEWRSGNTPGVCDDGHTRGRESRT